MSHSKLNDRINPAVEDNKQTIPKVIFQTYKTRNLQKGMYQAAKSWSKKNPDYDYYFFDDAAQRQLIERHFEQDVLEAYDKLDVGAFKADLWRYCVLFIYGGVYADIDTVCLQQLGKVISAQDSFIAPFAGIVPGGIFNAFICAKKGHPFLDASIKLATQMTLNGGHDHPLSITGPLCMGRAINRILGRDINTEFLEGKYLINGYDFKILEKKRSAVPEERTVRWKNQTIFLCKYPGYRKELRGSGGQHWDQFFNKGSM